MDYQIKVTYKRIKKLYLRVKNGMVLVSAPIIAKESTINNFINQNLDFINKALAKEKASNKDFKEHDIVTINKTDYEILATSASPKRTTHYLFLNNNESYSKQIKKLFKDDLLKEMTDLTKKYFPKINYNGPFPKITIKDVKSRYGCYNKRNHEISYASEMLFYDLDCKEYLVCHELSHLKVFDHSNKFYLLLESIYPNYKEVRKKLKEGANKYGN